MQLGRQLVADALQHLEVVVATRELARVLDAVRVVAVGEFTAVAVGCEFTGVPKAPNTTGLILMSYPANGTRA